MEILEISHYDARFTRNEKSEYRVKAGRVAETDLPNMIPISRHRVEFYVFFVVWCGIVWPGRRRASLSQISCQARPGFFREDGGSATLSISFT